MVLICVSLVTSDVGRLSRLVQGHPASQALCPFSDGQSVSWSRQGRRSVWGLAPSAPSLRRPGLLRGAFFPAPESAVGPRLGPLGGCACGWCAACLATGSRSCPPGLALGSGLCPCRCGGNPAGRGLRGGPGAGGRPGLPRVPWACSTGEPAAASCSSPGHVCWTPSASLTRPGQRTAFSPLVGSWPGASIKGHHLSPCSGGI